VPFQVLCGESRAFCTRPSTTAFDPSPELHARIEALLRRSRRRPGSGRMRIGPLEFDPIARHVWLHGERIHLSKKEFALLRAQTSSISRKSLAQRAAHDARPHV
jgi:DNA-binding response OmpR family regulator